MTREELFKQEIEPLMDKLAALCEQHQFPLVLSADKSAPEDEYSNCDTMLIGNVFLVQQVLVEVSIQFGKAVEAMKIGGESENAAGQ